MRAGTVLAGAAVRAVDVPVGTPMSGFAARGSGSTGVRDPLTVRALVLGEVALVAVDCCALHERTCAEVRADVLDEGLVREVVLHATHTHSGPCLSPERLGTDSPELRAEVERAVVEAVRTAAEARVLCTLSYGDVRGAGVARNRRHLDRAIDPPVQWVELDHDRRRLATLVSYPCHPVVLDAANTLISGDFIAPLRDRIEARHPGSVCVYATGAAGDVNTGHSAASSFVAGGAGRTFAESERIGGLLADVVLGSPSAAVVTEEPRVSTASLSLALEHIDLETVERDVRSWRAELSAGTGRSGLLSEWLRWADERPATPEATWVGRVSVVACGPLRIIALPGEPFLVAAERIRACHDGPMIVLGYCDGVPGYLPDDAEYSHGGYEVAEAHRYYGMPAPFARGSLERAIAAAVALVEELAG